MSYEDESSFLRDPLLKTPVEPFTFDKTRYSLKHFTERFAHHLPVVAMVTDGFCSPDEGKFTFSDDEVYWIACIKKQKRLLAKDESGLNVSIPYDHSMKWVVKGMRGEESGPFKMDKILELFRESAVDSIHPAKEQQVTVWQGAQSMDTVKLKKLEPVDVYEETYLVGNSVLMKHLVNYQIAIPVFLPIRLRVADGLVSNTKHEAFQAEMATLQWFTRPFPNRSAKGNPEIMIFTDEQIRSAEGNYQYIDPYAPVSSVPQLGAGGYEPVDREFKWTAVYSRRSLPPLPESDDENEKSKSKSKMNNENTGSQQTKEATTRKTREKYENIDSCGSREPSLNIYMELPKILKPKPSIKQKRTGVDKPKPHPKQEPKSESKPHLKPEPKRQPVIVGVADESDDANRYANREKEDYACADEIENVYAEIGEVPTDVDFLKSSVSEVSSYLRLLKLHKYIEPFNDHDIDGVMLLELDKEILMTDFNFSALEARKLCKFVHDGWRPKL